MLSVIGLMALALLMTGSSSMQRQALARPEFSLPIVRYATRFDTSIPLSKMQPVPSNSIYVGEIIDVPPRGRAVLEGSSNPSSPDPVLQGPVAGPSAAVIEANFEGVNNVNSVFPPDTEGDVGPNHYVQMINLSFAIWDKSGNLLYGPVNNNTLWQGFGGPCQNTNNGDPIVLYDHLADRWLMSQFALPNDANGPYYQCIAISQSPDPTGVWHRYEFLISNDKLNDYPKFGVWPDGYYMTTNHYTPVAGGGWNWAGQGVVAFEREQMLSGGTARMVYFDLEADYPDLGGMLPADLDGPVPPQGSPNPFVQIDDDAWGYAPDQLQVWNFHVDWSDPANSTFTFDSNLATAAFDSNLCNYARNCIPQPGFSANLDAISDKLMFRLQYRNFGTYQTLVVNHTVDVNGNDHAGIRWYELRDTGGGWDIFQQGTFAPDSDHRWMGSMAMNGEGDIALGYSVSSGNTYPSIRFTGRLAGDANDLMTIPETEIIAGSGYQSFLYERWGDYSTMSVDPADDCTFWYTQEYYATAGLFSSLWQTRISSFKLEECGPPTATTISSFNAEADREYIHLTWETSNEVDLIGFNLYRSTAMDGDKVRLNSTLIPAKSPGELTGASYQFFDQSVHPGVPYDYWLEAVKVGGPAIMLGPTQAEALYTIRLPLIKARK